MESPASDGTFTKKLPGIFFGCRISSFTENEPEMKASRLIPSFMLQNKADLKYSYS